MPTLADGEAVAMAAGGEPAGAAVALAEAVALGADDALGAGVLVATDADGADDDPDPCATTLGDGAVVCG